jgi:hypothetical protein
MKVKQRYVLKFAHIEVVCLHDDELYFTPCTSYMLSLVYIYGH